MSENSRARILQATAELIEHGGVSNVTFEGVATAAGVSRAGIVYHFRSKEDLLAGTYEYLAQRWDEHMSAQLDGPSADATPEQRLAAYLESHTQPAPRAALQLLLEIAENPSAQQHWNAVMSRWAPPPEGTDPEEIRRFVAGLAARGLWLHQVLTGCSLGDEQVRAVAAQISDGLTTSLQEG